MSHREPASEALGDESTNLHLHCLSDDLLLNILKRALTCPNTVATSRALAARRSHLTCRCGEQYFKPFFDKDVRHATNLWRDSVALAGLPDQIATYPLWCTSREAERLYDGLAGNHKNGGLVPVCTRWRDLLRPVSEVKVALCGFVDTPPPGVEAVILAWDWGVDGYVDWDIMTSFARFGGLQHLRVLIMWNPAQVPLASGYSDAMFRSAPPQIPEALLGLRHVVVHAPFLGLEYGEGLLYSLEQQRDLRTLVLPTFQSVDDCCFLNVTNNCEKLSALDSGSETPRLHNVSHLTHLRRLRVFTTDTEHTHAEHALAPANNDRAAPPLAGLTGLEWLELTCACSFGWGGSLSGGSGYMLPQLCEHRRLTHLHFEYLSLPKRALEEIATAPALESLKITNCAIDSIHPVTALVQLTSIQLCTDILPIRPLVRGLEALASLTRLASVEMQTCASTDGQLVDLSRHHGLTSLDLERCSLSAAECCSIAGLRALEYLNWRTVDVDDLGAGDVTAMLRPLTALRTMLFSNVPDSFGEEIAELQISKVYPDLQEIEVACCHSQCITDAIICQLAQLRDVGYVKLCNACVSEADMSKLARASELRRLDLIDVHGNFLDGLKHLSQCSELLLVRIRRAQVSQRPLDAEDFPFTVLWESS